MKNSEQEFLAAYDAHADALFRYCYARLGERERALDAVQETYRRAWQWLLKGNRANNFRALLYRMATNITIDEYRRGRDDSYEQLAERGFDVADSAPDPALSAHARHAIAAARKLEPQYRNPLLMRYVDDMPVKEIANIMQVSENTISVRIHRAIEQLKDILEPNHD